MAILWRQRRVKNAMRYDPVMFLSENYRIDSAEGNAFFTVFERSELEENRQFPRKKIESTREGVFRFHRKCWGQAHARCLHYEIVGME